MTFNATARRWLAGAIGVPMQNLEITRMQGSTSTSIYQVQTPHDGDPRRFVLRVVDNRDWLADEPDLAAHEAAALVEAERDGLAAPRLVAFSSGDDHGFGAPVVLMTFLAGDIVLQPADYQGWLNGLANSLAAIHRHKAVSFGWHFKSWVDRGQLSLPKWSSNPQNWECAIDLWLRTSPQFEPVFIHRDYHPTNVLWRQSSVSGIVDWINACQGPAGADVAHCRTNLVQMFSLAAADQFLEAYIQVAEGFGYDPFWDLDSILDMCLPRPNFYPPWQDFGLALIPPQVLDQRVDDYLASVLGRMQRPGPQKMS
jgi:Ser/Thr protein kinase RdoA (MazF antagonist)